MKNDTTLRVGTNEMELVDFRIFKEEDGVVYEGIYGVNVAKVREIIRVPSLVILPGVPDFIDGIFDLRGVVIPVVNLARWMGVTIPQNAEKNARVIITEFNNILIGFVVHEARRIRRINWRDIEPASFLSSGEGHGGSKITGVTRIEGEAVLLILDLETVVQELGLYKPNTSDVSKDIEKFGGLALVLDDSTTARKIVKDALEKMGFDVVEASDGEDGLERLDEIYAMYEEDISKHLKIIISDIEMPLMDGFHFAAKVKENGRYKNIPIVFNSSISNQFSEMLGKDAGAEGYLVKFDASTFYDEVARVVSSHMNEGE